MRALDPDPAIAARKRSPAAGDRTSVATRHAVTALAYIAQVAAIVAWGTWAHTHNLSPIRGLTWVALVILGSILTTIIHECGHAILAWCFQMDLVDFKAGPFQWAKRAGKWKFKFHIDGVLSAGAFPNSQKQPRWEEIIVTLGGPLANLLIGVPAIWAVLHDNWANYQQTWESVAFTGSFCLIAAVLNLFPFMAADGAYSDGARILQIVTRSHRTPSSIASTSLVETRPRYLNVAADDQPILPSTRPAVPIILPRVAAMEAPPLSQDLMEAAADRVFNPLDRILSSAPPPTSIPIAPVDYEHSVLIDALATLPVVVPEICKPSEIESVPIAVVCLSPEVSPETALIPITTAPVAGSPELALPAAEIAASRGLASFTRIAASSIVATGTPFTRVSLLPAIPAVSTAGVPPSLKAPAVPSAFARRAVRPVPAPPRDLYAETATNAVLIGLPAPVKAASAQSNSEFTDSIDNAAHALRPIAPSRSSVAPGTARFDPLESIRAAALENFPA